MKVTIKEGETLWEALAKENIVPDRPCGGRGACGRCGVWLEGIGRVLSCQFSRAGSYQAVPEKTFVFDTVSLNEDELRKNAETEGGVLRDIFALESSGLPNRAETEEGVLRDILASESSDLPNCAETEEEDFFIADVGTTTVAVVAVRRDGSMRTASFINPQRAWGADVLSRIKACAEKHQGQLQTVLWNQLAEAIADLSGESMGNVEAQGKKVYIGGNTTMLHIMQGYSCEGLGKAPFTPVSLNYRKDYVHIPTTGGALEIHYMPGISAFIGGDIVSGLYSEKIAESDEITLFLDFGTNGEMALGNRERLLCASAAAGPALEGSDLAVKVHASGIFSILRQMLEQGVMDEYGTLSDPWFEEGCLVEIRAAGPVLALEMDVPEIPKFRAEGQNGVSWPELTGSADVEPERTDGADALLEKPDSEDEEPERIDGTDVLQEKPCIAGEEQGKIDRSEVLSEKSRSMEAAPDDPGRAPRIPERIRITQEDIRQIQMAKAAIAAGIEILMKEYGIKAEQVERVFLAGGMGYYLDPGDAEAVGLLPVGLASKAKAVGNSCLRGLYLFAKEGTAARQRMEKMIRMTKEIILADHPDFQELYIDKMNF